MTDLVTALVTVPQACDGPGDRAVLSKPREESKTEGPLVERESVGRKTVRVGRQTM